MAVIIPKRTTDLHCWFNADIGRRAVALHPFDYEARPILLADAAPGSYAHVKTPQVFPSTTELFCCLSISPYIIRHFSSISVKASED